MVSLLMFIRFHKTSLLTRLQVMMMMDMCVVKFHNRNAK
jgi:hypothetical protein